MALHGAPRLENYLRERGIVPPRAEHVRKLPELRRERFVAGFKQLLERFREQRGGLRLVHLAKIGPHADGVRAFADNVRAEGVDGVYPRAVDQRGLAAHAPVRRVEGEPLGYRGGKPPAQLRRCRARVGYDEEAVNVRSVVDKPHQPLDEHARFARARTGRYEHRAAVVLYRRALHWGEVHAPPSFRFAVVSYYMYMIFPRGAENVKGRGQKSEDFPGADAGGVG